MGKNFQLEVISKEPIRKKHETPLLFVHGSWHAAWCWDEYFLDYFAEQGYSVYALSLRGHGKSEGKKQIRFFRLSHYVDDVVQIAAQLPKPPVVIGHSMGGGVVQKYLEKHMAPAGVLMASVPCAGMGACVSRLTLRHPLVSMKLSFSLSMYNLVSTTKLAREMLFSKDMDTETLNKYYSRLQEESFFGFLDTVFLNLPKPKRIKVPIMVMGAEKDTIFVQKEIQATARAYHTQAVIMPGMYHDMMLDARWKSAADKILEWLGEKGL